MIAVTIPEPVYLPSRVLAFASRLPAQSQAMAKLLLTEVCPQQRLSLEFRVPAQTQAVCLGPL